MVKLIKGNENYIILLGASMCEKSNFLKATERLILFGGLKHPPAGSLLYPTRWACCRRKLLGSVLTAREI